MQAFFLISSNASLILFHDDYLSVFMYLVIVGDSVNTLLMGSDSKYLELENHSVSLGTIQLCCCSSAATV